MRGRRRGLVPAGSCVQRGAYLRVTCVRRCTLRLLPQHPQWPPLTPHTPAAPSRGGRSLSWPLVLQEFQAF